MFKFLKEKIKGAIDRITKKVEKEAPEETKEVEVEIEEKPEKKKVEIKKKEKKKEKKVEEDFVEEVKEEITEEVKVEKIEKPVEEKVEEKLPEEKKGLFKRFKEKVTTKKISESKFDELFNELEIALLENNVALEVIDKIKEDLKMDLVNVPIRKKEIHDKIKNSLRESINDLFVDGKDLVKRVKESKEKPFVIVFVGVNGSGKTTTIAKLSHLFLDNDLKPVMVASDTFRAAAIHQLEEQGRRTGVKVIKHDYGADPAAVAFDGIKYAKAHKLDAVLIDTAGRLHSNINLMDEMKKIVRVSKPHMKIFVGEAITGNDCIEQAKKFNDAIDIDGIILTKADVDEKGGAFVSVGFVTREPILYLGIGQSLNDLKEFNKDEIVESFGL